MLGISEMKENAWTEVARKDPLRRFTPTPYRADLPVMGRTIRLETNHPAVLDRVRTIFRWYGSVPTQQARFQWRIIADARSAVKPPWPPRTAFSDDGLRFASFGQFGFFAINLDEREAVGYIAEELIADEPGFVSPYLDTLFCMTAEAQGLASLAANCVALDERGLLILGEPNSGKTTSSYLAGRSGLEFHSDQAVFLELQSGGLRAWGQFWPVIFRSETREFLPELGSLTRPLRYRESVFLHLEKNSYRAAQARSVIPVSCLFLERQRSNSPFLARLPESEFVCRLRDGWLLQEDDRFDPQRTAVQCALEQLPAYRLSYGHDPGEAISFYRRILSDKEPSELTT